MTWVRLVINYTYQPPIRLGAFLLQLEQSAIRGYDLEELTSFDITNDLRNVKAGTFQKPLGSAKAGSSGGDQTSPSGNETARNCDWLAALDDFRNWLGLDAV